MKNIENKIEQAMVVLYQDTGKMLNYRQLLRHSNPEIRKAWAKSAGNEYRRLADGVGNRIKGTKTIRFH